MNKLPFEYIPIIIAKWYMKIFKKIEDPEIYGVLVFYALTFILLLGSSILLGFRLNRYWFVAVTLAVFVIYWWRFVSKFETNESISEYDISKTKKIYFLVYVIFSATLFSLGLLLGKGTI